MNYDDVDDPVALRSLIRKLSLKLEVTPRQSMGNHEFPPEARGQDTHGGAILTDAEYDLYRWVVHSGQ
jgi:hypothetical protein